MRKIKLPGPDQWDDLIQRPSHEIEDIERTVNQIFGEVRTQGDPAVNKYTQLFDGSSPENLEVSQQEILRAIDQVSGDLKRAIGMAKDNIESFHAAQKTQKVSVETTPGVVCWQEKKPIQKIGLYIPGGTAPLFSTILMLAVPARIAGCEELVLCTPPGKQGEIDPVILYTADLCGIQKIYKVGGIQAIAGMTFGTQTISKVYKIFGPGNQFVTVAKQMATKHHVAIDMPAGPSELMIMADDSAVPAFIASDLLSQAEHGPDSQVILVSCSERLIDLVEGELVKQLQALPRKAIAQEAIAHSRSVLMCSDKEALDFMNAYAPEHLIICTENEDFFVDGLANAGSVFVGNHTPESAGDYASGTNHTLPTNGYSRQYSGITLDSFLKSISFQKISEEGIRNIGPTIELLAEAEGLEAHKKAVSLRLQKIKKENKDD